MCLTPGSSTPVSSVGGGVGGVKYRGKLEKMKKEFEVREKKLRQNIDELKTKSRKAITSLKAQLADVHNRRGDDLEVLKDEVEELNTHLRSALEENSSLEDKITSLETDKERLVERIDECERELQEQTALVEQQQEELERVTHQGQTSSNTEYQPMQWQDEQLTPRSVGLSPFVAEATPPTIPMEEVMIRDDGQSFASGSIDLQGSGRSPGGGRGVHFLPTSLDQSVNSMDFAPVGSPLEAASLTSGDFPSTAPPPLQQMLIQSRMSYHSPAPQVSCVCVFGCVCVQSAAYSAYDCV